MAYRDIGGMAVLVDSNVTRTVFTRDFLIKDSAGAVWLEANADWKRFGEFREELERRIIRTTGERPRYFDDSALGTAMEASRTYGGLAVFLAGFMVFLLLLSHSFLEDWYHDYRLRGSGVRQFGTVTKMFEVKNGRKAMTYVYDADGTPMRGGWLPHIGLWERYSEGGPVEIAFLPDEPEVSRTWDELHAMYIPYDMLAAVLAALLLGTVVYTVRYRRCRRYIAQVR